MTKREFAERYEILFDEVREEHVSALDMINSIYETEDALSVGDVNEIRDNLEYYIMKSFGDVDEAKMLLEALNENVKFSERIDCVIDKLKSLRFFLNESEVVQLEDIKQSLSRRIFDESLND